jgi:hypothetical protein
MRNSLKIRCASLALIKLAFLSSLWGCLAPSTQLDTISHIRFISAGRIPVAEGKINGKKAFFIIDTGASCSILNESASEHFGFKYFLKIDDHVFGLSGRAKTNQAFNYVIEFGPHKITQVVFRTKHMNDLAAVIREAESIDIAGIIGSDVLYRYKITIDFRNNTILF